jgi:hypothetical protein
MMFKTFFTTRRDFDSVWMQHWRSIINLRPDRFHRKDWENAAVIETIQSSGCYGHGKRGIGFGVGDEILSELFVTDGCQITATDLLGDDWGTTHNGMNRLRGKQNIDVRIVDMNWLRGESHRQAVESEAYDFSWSVCSADHCGSVWLTKRFLLNQMNVLRPGGIAVHTAEYSTDGRMPRQGGTSFMTAHDVMDLQSLAYRAGYEMAPVDWFFGDTFEDHIVDYQGDGAVHIKSGTENSWATCVLFALRKRVEGELWLSSDEAAMRALLADTDAKRRLGLLGG